MIVGAVAELVFSINDFFRRLWAVKFRIIVHDLIRALICHSINDRYRRVCLVRRAVISWRVVGSVCLIAELSRCVNFSLVQYQPWATVRRALVSLSVFLTVDEPLQCRGEDAILLNDSFLWVRYPTFNYFLRLVVRYLTKFVTIVHFEPANRAIIADSCWLLAHSISDAWLPFLSHSIWGLGHAAEFVFFREKAEKVALCWAVTVFTCAIERTEGRRRWDASITQNDFVNLDWNQSIPSAAPLEGISVKFWELYSVYLTTLSLDFSLDSCSGYYKDNQGS